MLHGIYFLEVDLNKEEESRMVSLLTTGLETDSLLLNDLKDFYDRALMRPRAKSISRLYY